MQPCDRKVALVDYVESIKHRGPDGSALVVHETTGCTIGFSRLAIINVSPSGMQPFQSFGVTSVCNGEIYNYKTLSVSPLVLRSDVEVINEMLAPKPDLRKTVDRIDGDFAFFAVLPDDSFLAARDPVGVRPLFYGLNTSNEVMALASEAKGLCGVPGVHTVKVFPPGNIWTPSQGFQTYTTVFEMPQIQDLASVEENVCKLLERAVEKRLRHSDVPVALLCSGGLDSSLVLAIAAKLDLGSKLHAFSVEFHDGSARSMDAMYAGLLTSHLGVGHTRVAFTMSEIQESLPYVIRACETYDPNTIRAALPMYLLAQHIHVETQYKAILSGERADEVFCGYNYFGKTDADVNLQEESRRLVQNLHMFDLLRADRCFAAFGLEVRVPFLDADLLRYCMALPGSLRGFKNGVEKALLRDAFRGYTALNCARIIDRQKERLSDGCGLTYVPSLLTWLGEAKSTLDERTFIEKQKYLTVFESFYPNSQHLITERCLPEWVKQTGGAPTNSLIGF